MKSDLVAAQSQKGRILSILGEGVRPNPRKNLFS